MMMLIDLQIHETVSTVVPSGDDGIDLQIHEIESTRSQLPQARLVVVIAVVAAVVGVVIGWGPDHHAARHLVDGVVVVVVEAAPILVVGRLRRAGVVAAVAPGVRDVLHLVVAVIRRRRPRRHEIVVRERAPY